MNRIASPVPSTPARPSSFPELRWRSLLGAVLVTGAGMLWLSLTSQLSDAGQHINELEARHRELREARITALTAHSQATDPRQLEQRALAMGLVRVQSPEALPVRDVAALPPGGSGRPQALDIVRLASGAANPPAPSMDLGAVLVSVGAAAPAEAAERPDLAAAGDSADEPGLSAGTGSTEKPRPAAGGDSR
jgi:hypothetical protein